MDNWPSMTSTLDVNVDITCDLTDLTLDIVNVNWDSLLYYNLGEPQLEIQLSLTQTPSCAYPDLFEVKVYDEKGTCTNTNNDERNRGEKNCSFYDFEP